MVLVPVVDGVVVAAGVMATPLVPEPAEVLAGALGIAFGVVLVALFVALGCVPACVALVLFVPAAWLAPLVVAGVDVVVCALLLCCLAVVTNW